MDNMKKMLLVDPRLFDRLQGQDEYKELVKIPTTKMKAATVGSLRSTLEEDQLPDDIKAKMYQQQFSRFMNIKDKVPVPTPLKRGVLPITYTSLAAAAEPQQREEREAGPSGTVLTRARKEWMRKAHEITQLLSEKEKDPRNAQQVKQQRTALELIDNPGKRAKYHDYLKEWWKKEEQRMEQEDEEDDDSFLDAESPKSATARRPASTSSAPAKKSGRGFHWINY